SAEPLERVVPEDLPRRVLERKQLPAGRREEISFYECNVDEVRTRQRGAPDFSAGGAIESDDCSFDANEDVQRRRHGSPSLMNAPGPALSRAVPAGRGVRTRPRRPGCAPRRRLSHDRLTAA